MSDFSVDAVIAYWKAHDVPFLPGLDNSELAAFERQYRVTVPQDMRCFYATTDGTRVPLQDGQDHDAFSFYRLSEIAPDADYAWAMNFADYREMSWWYAIDLTGGGGFGLAAIVMLGARGGRPLVVARSFTEFLDLYVRGDDRIWQSGALAYHKSLFSAGE